MTDAVALGIPTVREESPVLAPRRPTRRIKVGDLYVGGDAPITVQSMTTTKTHDIGATLQQIAELTAAGCDIVRVACPTDKDAGVLPIIAASRIPVIADIHFQPKYVFAAIEAGCGAVRVNPGNIRKFDDQVAEICKAASDHGVSLRIGVNAGSLDRRLLKKYGKATLVHLADAHPIAPCLRCAGLFQGGTHPARGGLAGGQGDDAAAESSAGLLAPSAPALRAASVRSSRIGRLRPNSVSTACALSMATPRAGASAWSRAMIAFWVSAPSRLIRGPMLSGSFS